MSVAQKKKRQQSTILSLIDEMVEIKDEEVKYCARLERKLTFC